MSRADDYLAQYRSKIASVGQWIAIRRYAGTTVKTYTDTLTRAYIRYLASTEFVGAVTQADLIAVALVDTLQSILPITNNDKLVTQFWGFDDPNNVPSMNAENHVSGGKETAIKSPIKRAPGGVLIALELQALG